MKTLILYASKYGAAEEIARRIAREIDGATTHPSAVVHDIKQSGIPAIGDFDCVVVGSSLYAGSIRKEAKAFVIKNAGALGEKKLGLFLSGLGQDNGYFEKNFPRSLLDKAKATGFLGGIFDPEKANGIERFIMKIVAKQNAYSDSIDQEAITRFVDAMK